jgi:DNA/RNA endonuclease G (NUC1)
VIGENGVAVPTHLFKIVLVEDRKLPVPLISAFVVPNRPIPRQQELRDFR